MVARRDHPEHLHALHWLARTGRLVAVLPGVYARPVDVDRTETRLAAAARWHPDGIFLGTAAARLSFRPKQRVNTIVMATRAKRKAPRGIALVRWDVPDELVVEQDGVRLATPAWSRWISVCATREPSSMRCCDAGWPRSISSGRRCA